MKRHAMSAIFVAACGGNVVEAGDETGETTGDGTGSSGASSSAESSGPTSEATSEPPSDDSSSGTPIDAGVDDPPLPTSRLVLDVETAGGHALMLQAIVDGEPRDAVQLTADAPATTRFDIATLGTPDRVALTVTLGGGEQDLFLVDWSAGHPAVVTQLDADVPGADQIGTPVWIDELEAIAVFIGGSYYRIDVSDASPVDLFDDVAFAVAFREQSRFVMPVGPFVAGLGRDPYENLYVAEASDPDAPTEALTDYDGTLEPSTPDQLASGHLVFDVGSPAGSPEDVAEIHVVLRADDAWSDTLVVAPPDDMPGARCFLIDVRPQSDDFLYGCATLDGTIARMLWTQVADGAIAPSIVLDEDHPGEPMRHLFARDGARLLYVFDLEPTLQLVTFGDAGPSRTQTLAPTLPPTAQWWRPVTLTADDEWVYLEARREPYDIAAVVRVALEGDVSQVVAGDVPMQGIEANALAPDDRWLAFTTAGVMGLDTNIVDVTGAEPGEPLPADHGDAPILNNLLPSPDSTWLAATTGHGGGVDTVVVTRHDDPAHGVLAVTDLVDEPVWLP